MSNAVSLVKNTRFEELVTRIQRDQEEKHDSDLNTKRKHDLVRSIASVYFFLRRKYGMIAGSLDVEDYKTAHETLVKIARTRVQKWRYRVLPSLLYRTTAWGYFLTHGFFSLHKTPFGGWFHSGGHQVHFSAETLLLNKLAAWDINIVPSNIRELVDALYEEKYGKNGGKHE